MNNDQQPEQESIPTQEQTEQASSTLPVQAEDAPQAPLTNEEIAKRATEPQHTSEVVQPKQEAYPNLNAGNPPPEDNNYAEKWKTPEERIIACEQYCSYLRQGRDKKYYPEADENTIKRYIEKYPKEFRPEKIADAERKGFANLEATVIQASRGKIPGANATLLIWLTKNKLKWKDRVDHTTDDDKLEVSFHSSLKQDE